MPNQPIEIGQADTLLAEGRTKAKREQISFMDALKIVIRKRINDAITMKSESNSGEKDER